MESILITIHELVFDAKTRKQKGVIMNHGPLFSRTKKHIHTFLCFSDVYVGIVAM